MDEIGQGRKVSCWKGSPPFYQKWRNFETMNEKTGKEYFSEHPEELCSITQAQVLIQVEDGKLNLSGSGNITGFLVAFTELGAHILHDLTQRLSFPLEDAVKALETSVEIAREEAEGKGHDPE